MSNKAAELLAGRLKKAAAMIRGETPAPRAETSREDAAALFERLDELDEKLTKIDDTLRAPVVAEYDNAGRVVGAHRA